MPLPNFIGIGAAKSGTTALYEYLRQHPQIYMSPVREPGYFVYAFDPDQARRPYAVTAHEAYQALFAGARGHLAVGEISPIYMLRSDVAAGAIHRMVPEARLIAVLRHPADRAYSGYVMQRGFGRERLGFSDALRASELESSVELQYRRNGLYAAQLRPFLRYFARDRLRVYLYEEWRHTPLAVLGDLFAFLGVAPDFVPDMRARHRVGKLPRVTWLNDWLQQEDRSKRVLRRLLPPAVARLAFFAVRNANSKAYPPLDPDLRRQLTEACRPDILELQELLGRDLSHWLNDA